MATSRRRISDARRELRTVLVVVLNEVPTGFGVKARSTEECQTSGPEALVVYHQADVGDNLRERADLV